MNQNSSVSRFDALSQEIVSGALPYYEPAKDRYAAVFTYDPLPDAVLILVPHGDAVETALSVRGDIPLSDVEKIRASVDRFLSESLRGEEGELLEFSYLPRPTALRRLRELLGAR